MRIKNMVYGRVMTYESEKVEELTFKAGRASYRCLNIQFLAYYYYILKHFHKNTFSNNGIY